MSEQTYFNGNGKRQYGYTKKMKELVPANGKAGTLQGEVLRAANYLYFSWFNDGERISEDGFRTNNSKAESAQCFLHEAVKLIPGSKMLELVYELATDVAVESDGPSYAESLELLLDTAVAFAGMRPLIPSDVNFCDRKWRDNYIKTYRDI